MGAKHLLAFLRPRLSKLADLSLATLASSAARRVEEETEKLHFIITANILCLHYVRCCEHYLQKGKQYG